MTFLERLYGDTSEFGKKKQGITLLFMKLSVSQKRA